jgi:hypothetical protein
MTLRSFYPRADRPEWLAELRAIGREQAIAQDRERRGKDGPRSDSASMGGIDTPHSAQEAATGLVAKEG